MSSLRILEQLEACGNARTRKVEILKSNKSDSMLRAMVCIAYDFRTTFGITTRPLKIGRIDEHSMDNWKDFVRLLHLYANRDLTGNAAKKQWSIFMDKCSVGERKWYTRVLNRDLKCGVSVKTINAAWPKAIPVFGVMLAHTYKPEKIKLKFPIATEPKLDGMRVVVVIRNNAAKAYSRKGLELPTLQFIADECVELVEPDYDCVFDGEIFSTNWNETIHLVKTEELPATLRDKLTYYVFDFVSYAGFSKGIEVDSYKDRRRGLEYFEQGIAMMSKDEQGCHIEIVGMELCYSQSDIDICYNAALGNEYEGIMLKDLGAPYKEGRANHWLKHKPEETTDAPIIGWYEGREGTKNEGKLGGFIVKLENDEELRVGGGYTDKQREQFWAEKGIMKGRWLEFKAQVETSEKAVCKSARCGRYIRFREDK